MNGYYDDKLAAERPADSGKFEVLNTANRLPIVTVTLKAPGDYTVFDLSHKLRERGWIVPAYTLPPDAENIAIMRVVVKENFSRDTAGLALSRHNERDPGSRGDQGRAPRAEAFCPPRTLRQLSLREMTARELTG